MGGSPGYARYVGRVGGLAAALGIGAALLTGTAVASAETTDSKSTSSSSSESGSSSENTRGTTKASAGKSPSERAAAQSSGDESEDAESDDTDTESEAGDEDVDVADDDVADDATVADDDATVADDEEDTSAQALAAVDAEDQAAADERSWLEKLFDNESPTINPNPAENTVIDGNVVGTLNPEDPDSTRLTYTATRPEHGTVVIGSDGTFVYSPGESYAGQDSFQVTISDARDGFHIHGAAAQFAQGGQGLRGLAGRGDQKRPAPVLAHVADLVLEQVQAAQLHRGAQCQPQHR